MAKSFTEHIVDSVKNMGVPVVLTENSDGFLMRNDVIKSFNQHGIVIDSSTRLKQRIKFELREKDNPDKILLFLSEDNTDYLEDIVAVSRTLYFHLSDYFDEYHLPSIIHCELDILDKLFQNKPLTKLSKKETNDYLEKLKTAKNIIPPFDLNAFQEKIKTLVDNVTPDWNSIIMLLSEALIETIGGESLEDVISVINEVNNRFQKDLQAQYKQLASSSPVKKPKVVSKILDHINLSGRDRKIALIVIDGMSYWQYLLLSKRFPQTFHFKNDYIYSWIPSITQLSRQAIFKGDTPVKEYIQNPENEEKLWKRYWTGKGFGEFEIRYDYEKVRFEGLGRITKLAVVFKDLDDKMHGSTDYKDLKSLTENWIKRSNIVPVIQKLLDKKFTIYITTDHGNILAKGWRNLKGKEKLGTNKSGSRSQRHLEYSDDRLAEEFFEANNELSDYISLEENVIYFTGDYSFSPKESLITHGGSHILEVVIPFITIDYEY